jgi:photosystem II stability/assembly factor-like uncharacterized protein
MFMSYFWFLNVNGSVMNILLRFVIPIFLVMNVGTCKISAQWTRQSPIPTGEEITDISFISPDTGWIFGFHGTILRTDDTGDTWTDQSLPVGDDIRFGIFLDSETGWLTLSGEYPEYNGSIYGTSDGGYHWDLQYNEAVSTIHGLSFIDRYTGWALASFHDPSPLKTNANYLLKTTDGGDSWVFLGSIPYAHFSKVDFVNSTTGYIAGAGMPNLMKTTNGGLSWQDAPNASNAGLRDVLFTATEHGYTCGNNFYYTHDGGSSWDYTYCYHPKSVGMYDHYNGWTISIDKVFKVTDGGANLDYQFTVDKSLLVDLSVVDATTAYVIGKQVTILATHDGSESWQEISKGTPNSLYSIFFLNEHEGWAGGENHTLLNTHDGGEHWSACNNITASEAISAIQFINADTGWYFGGNVYRTTDGGLTWSQLTGLLYPVSGMYFLNDQSGWCVGPNGKLFKTINGGLDWEVKISGTTDDLKAIFFLDESHGWIAGDGIILKTADGGETWNESYADLADFFEMIFFDDLTGYALSESYFLKTADGGTEWEIVVPQGMAGSLNDFSFVDQDTGYLSGSNFLLKTYDGGVNWETINNLPDIQMNAIFITSSSKGWIAGHEGAIYFTASGGLVNIQNPGRETCPFAYSIFPNPAWGIVKINYQLNKQEDVEIGLYSLQGQLIRYYKDDGLIPGNYTFEWAPAFLNSGICLCRIKIGDQHVSEKIIYIK